MEKDVCVTYVNDEETDFVYLSDQIHSRDSQLSSMSCILTGERFMVLIQEENPDCVVRGFRMRDIASKGGALHCITWNIKR